MKLCNILSTNDINILNNIISTPTDAETYAPKLSFAHQQLYEFAGNNLYLYSVSFWKNLQAEYTQTREVVVCIKQKKVTVMQIRHNKIFARHINTMLKNGTKICCIIQNRVIFVKWGNWKEVYSLIANTENEGEYDTQLTELEKKKIKINSDRERMFHNIAKSNCYKKLGKRGYNLSFDEVRAQQRQEEYDKRLRSTIREAKQILAVL